MRKSKLIFLCIVVEVMLIICVTLANVNPTPALYFIFYNSMISSFFYFIIQQLIVCTNS